MIESLLTVGKQVIILFLLISVGFVCTKKRFFTKEGIAGITNFVLYFVTPCVIIDSFSRPFEKEMLTGLGYSVLAATGIHLFNILLAHTLIKDKDEQRERVLRFGLVFSNCGFMALPLQEALLGSEGVFYGAAYIAIFNLLVWTYGIIEIGGNKERITLKKIFINPGVIAVAIGLILFLTPLDLPQIILSPVKSLAALNTPLPMAIIGYYLAQITTLKVLLDKKMIWTMILRLLIAPGLSLVILYLIGMKGILLPCMIIAASAPTAANTVMFASKYERDTSLSVTLISFSTLLSILTMPIVVSIAMFLAK